MARHRLLTLGLAALACAVAPPCAMMSAPALAQEAQAPQGDDVVVVGRRMPEAKEAVRKLTRKVSLATDGQLARFDLPICPTSLGMPASFNTVVARRVATVAKSAGIAVAKPGCRPNITVVFVDDGRAVLDELYRTKPNAVSAISVAQRKRSLADTGPVRVLTVTELRSRDGDRLSKTINGIGAGKEHIPILEVRSASIINPPTRQDINGVLVLVDVRATVGKSLRQIADHVAMRTLARTESAGVAPDDETILGLFNGDGAAAPASLTAFDHAYLTALYRGPATRSGVSKTAAIAARINAQRERGEP